MNRFFRRSLYAVYAFLLLLFAYQCRQLNDQVQSVKENLKTSRDSISYFKLKDGSYSAEKRSYEVTIADYKQAVLKSRDSVKQMKERIGNLNNLVNDLNFQLSVQEFVSIPVYDTVVVSKSDTNKVQSINYRDSWLSLQGILYPDTLKLKYEVKAALSVATHWKPDGIFRPKYLAVNIHSDNPNLHVEEMENFRIREKKRFFQTRGFAFATGLLSGLLLQR